MKRQYCHPMVKAYIDIEQDDPVCTSGSEEDTANVTFDVSISSSIWDRGEVEL